MFLVTPPKDADQVRHGATAKALGNAMPAAFPARVATKSELRTREFPKSFDQASLQLTQTLAGNSPTNAESITAAVLEQMLLLRWLDDKGWLGNGRNVWREQFQLHWEADPESTSFYTSFVLPRARVLSAAGLLSQALNQDLAFTQTTSLSNELCKTIFDSLFLPFRYTLAEISDKEAETQLEASILSTLFTRQMSEATKRPTSAFVAPRRVARWMCRETLVQYLGAKLSESTQLADAELTERLEAFFDLPNAAALNDEQVAALHNLFLRSEAQRMSRALLSCRVCDPSSGS